MPGNASAGQLTRGESVLDSMTLSPGGARGCNSGLEDGWDQPFICFLSFWKERRGCVTVAVGEKESEAASERDNARSLKPWGNEGNE